MNKQVVCAEGWGNELSFEYYYQSNIFEMHLFPLFGQQINAKHAIHVSTIGQYNFRILYFFQITRRYFLPPVILFIKCW